MIKDRKKTEIGDAPVKGSIALLKKSIAADQDASEHNERVKKIQDSFARLKINAKICAIFLGATVSGYEFLLKNQTGINSIKKHIEVIENDLDVDRIRIVDYWRSENRRVPVQNVDIDSFVTVCETELFVMLEIPNSRTTVVRIGDIMDSPEFRLSEAALPIVLGKNIRGKNIVYALEKMPHLLIGGNTGSGKSICLHSIITSLICNNSPSDVRLLLADYNRIEFDCYSELPHMLTTKPMHEMSHVVNALRWAKEEMNRRFDLLIKGCVRNICEYNSSASVLNCTEKRLPYIVIIIDDYSNFMLSCKHDIEDIIKHLDIKARAVGIHLIFSTQRPSPDVVTGMIKANFISRISFRLSNYTHSKVILNESDAEKLLDNGDMLFYPSDATRPERIQGCYVSPEEVSSVVDYIKQTSPTEFDSMIEKEIFGC